MNHFNRRKALQFGAAAGVAGFFAAPASAQKLPDTARIVVGFPAGGAPDLVARRLADSLNGKLAKTVIVDNRAGAGGRIAADVARQAPADGTTLLLNPAGMLTINPHVYRKLNYDPFKDFAPLSIAAVVDFGFGVGAGVPAEVKTLADFATWAKANPGRASYGSPAAGSPPHFVGDAIGRALGVPMTHIPYRGGAPALNDLMGGQLTSLVLTLGDMIQNARAGKLRLLASTGPTRSRFAPDVRTFSEQNVKGLEHRDWFGVYIAGQPKAQVLADVGPIVRDALRSREYVLALNTAGIEAASGSAQDLDKLARTDLERWGPLVKATGFQADT